MNNSQDEPRARDAVPEKIPDARRRALLLAIPAAVFATLGATLAAVAYRFLRPAPQEQEGSGGAGGAWAEVGPASALAGRAPVLRKVVVERRAGWSRAREERAVFVLPGAEVRVVSAVCPHEQCEVAWLSDAGQFQCPCHDSRFSADGARLTGPAATDLEPLPARVERGVLQVQFRARGDA